MRLGIVYSKCLGTQTTVKVQQVNTKTELQQQAGRNKVNIACICRVVYYESTNSGGRQKVYYESTNLQLISLRFASSGRYVVPLIQLVTHSSWSPNLILSILSCSVYAAQTNFRSNLKIVFLGNLQLMFPVVRLLQLAIINSERKALSIITRIAVLHITNRNLTQRCVYCRYRIENRTSPH